jgi:urease accessory protein
MKKLLALVSLLVACAAAQAHSEGGGAGGFVQGFLHPFSGGDHLLAMVGVGMWGAILGPPLVWSLPVAFPLMMVAGAVLAIAGFGFPAAELGVAASVLVLGGGVALRWKAPPPVALAIIGCFGLLHGHAHGSELPASVSPVAFAFGFVMASGLLHAAGIALGLLRASATGEQAFRLLGGLTCGAGAWMLITRAVAA